ncbi:Actin- protein 2/3 complex subunit 5 [Rhizophlyctis rosea]|uniref:Actin-related protein 2/3 complex subunit 5 n=1 Tax=Rhizophlyctis rosea TaxID=64517 RepID=A0AAD5SJB6_9FUNG|nr:Actin- protein 2/3 complex subunit 5 [Rhizophlyctis rosea]
MSHRKVDVDFVDDEDAFVDENQTAASATLYSAEAESAVDARVNDARRLVSSGNMPAAVSRVLENPPAGPYPQSLKDKNTAIVLETLLAVRPNDMPAIVKSLSSTQLDTLMKYIYRGMAQPEAYNSGLLLTWHEKVTEAGGVGVIVRVLTDRKTV